MYLSYSCSKFKIKELWIIANTNYQSHIFSQCYSFYQNQNESSNWFDLIEITEILFWFVALNWTLHFDNEKYRPKWYLIGIAASYRLFFISNKIWAFYMVDWCQLQLFAIAEFLKHTDENIAWRKAGQLGLQ